mmetsp:Transcript_80755/g.207895  ORF Transcript_80755/g.207895 Transcript_80755/m.207895 type:complete len:213 (-) Transcript_80755:156-794(-)
MTYEWHGGPPAHRCASCCGAAPRRRRASTTPWQPPSTVYFVQTAAATTERAHTTKSSLPTACGAWTSPCSLRPLSGAVAPAAAAASLPARAAALAAPAARRPTCCGTATRVLTSVVGNATPAAVMRCTSDWSKRSAARPPLLRRMRRASARSRATLASGRAGLMVNSMVVAFECCCITLATALDGGRPSTVVIAAGPLVASTRVTRTSSGSR